jgi:hypothetical protein
MDIKAIISQWSSMPKDITNGKEYCIKLSLTDAACIEAIKELYPGLTTQMIINQLLNSALQSFEEALPYIPGSKVSAEDEMGDPMYEDIGDTPRYLTLIEKHRQLLETEIKT